MNEFRRITLFCLEKRLSKHKMAICSKNLGVPWPLRPPWLRLYSVGATGADASLHTALNNPHPIHAADGHDQ